MRIQSQSLLDRVARQISRPPTSAPDAASLLSRIANAYSALPVIDEEMGLTSFDPDAAALFEAVVEATFLVAHADGHFDAEERAAFQTVVSSACGGAVKAPRLDALIADFTEQLAEDGQEKRTRMIGRTITVHHQQMEVMRMAALMAWASGGVSAEERVTLELLAAGLGLARGSVDTVLAQAAAALDLDGVT
ncbi:TerB family tellurite resistance protein [Chondromyces crocatus]|uniref:Co-chaperone DjlA N-terminal domain-containing protein n=1 Tax=Chondromyces crocatus TaxID=52 RepID=A0A0K1ENM1_CHOCO|nr:TerB family tellurite resistance protein [Chondromyces crocatus]AKT42441.1 uncharacterized protein CMC5_066670 [Chondromyces crocatus]